MCSKRVPRWPMKETTMRDLFTKWMPLAVALLGCCACGAPVIPIVAYDERPGGRNGRMLELPEEITEGCEILGLDCVHDDEDGSRGAIVFVITLETGSGRGGRELDDG